MVVHSAGTPKSEVSGSMVERTSAPTTGAEHIAEAAGDDGTADDHGCDCIKFPADAHGVDGRADVGRVHDGSEGGQRGGGQIDDVLRALDRKTHQLGRGTGTADRVDSASCTGVVQQDIAEDNHKNRDDHAHIDVEIMGDLRIVDDGDLLRYEIEVVVLGGRSAPWWR